MNKQMSLPASLQVKRRPFSFLRSVSALILREMATTYGRSPGGYIWAILEPVAAVAVLSFVFSYVLRAPGLGTNFPFFYATGYLPFGLYMAVSASVASAIRFSRQLLEYPGVTFLDALVARFTLNLLTQILVIFIVMTGIILIYDLTPILYWPAIAQSILLAAAFAFGIGAMNCYLFTSYPIWERIWAVINRPLFFISCIFFLPENLSPQLREFLMYNPLAHITSLMRKGFYPTYDAVHVDQTYVFLVSLGLISAGLFLLMRHYKDLLLK